MRGLGFVLGRPARTLALEILFGALGLLPLLVWLLVGPVWDGRELGEFALILAGQQLVVLLRILTRAGHLGAASAYLRRSKEVGVSASGFGGSGGGAPAASADSAAVSVL